MMAVFLSSYVFPTRYSLGATQIQGAQTRLPNLILPCITPSANVVNLEFIFITLIGIRTIPPPPQTG